MEINSMWENGYPGDDVCVVTNWQGENNKWYDLMLLAKTFVPLLHFEFENVDQVTLQSYVNICVENSFRDKKWYQGYTWSSYSCQGDLYIYPKGGWL